VGCLVLESTGGQTWFLGPWGFTSLRVHRGPSGACVCRDWALGLELWRQVDPKSVESQLEAWVCGVGFDPEMTEARLELGSMRMGLEPEAGLVLGSGGYSFPCCTAWAQTECLSFLPLPMNPFLPLSSIQELSSLIQVL
jgi:hypothetical protein